MKTILLGSTNKSKFDDYKDLIPKEKINLIDLSCLANVPKIEEDHIDIVGNSLKKAITLAKLSNLPTIGDDTGVFIDALGGAPGVSVRRWQGELPEDISDKDWVEYFLKKIDGISGEKLTAKRIKVVSLAMPDGRSGYETIESNGRIVVKSPRPGYIKGGPFSAFFFQDKYSKFEAELSEEEKQEHFGLLKKGVEKLLLRFSLI